MATYSYGKKTRVRRSGVKAIGPTSAELERQVTARMASAPPIPDRIGDAYRQRRQQKQAFMNERYRGRDGGIAQTQTPARIQSERDMHADGWAGSQSGLYTSRNNIGRRSPKRSYRY